MTAEKLTARSYHGVAMSLFLPALLGACTSLERHTIPTATPSRHAAAIYRIAHLGYGDDGYFATCLVPVCPGVTPKTPAMQPQLDAIAQDPVTPMVPPVAVPPTLVVHFPTGSSVLAAEDAAQLAHWHAQAPRSGVIAIAGRTDNVGGAALNRRLASARAQAIATYLQHQLHVAPARLAWEGRGLCCYVDDNTTVSGRTANRRAEVSLRPPLEEGP